MIGTVPMYDAIGYLEKDLADIKATDFLQVLEAHAKEGVDFQTIHAGINRRAVEALKRQKRTTNIVSRGGSLLFACVETKTRSTSTTMMCWTFSESMT